MKAIKSILLSIIRFFVVWFVDTISLLITAWVIPGIAILQVGDVGEFVVATVAALLLGIVNLLIRPLLLLITVPLGWMVVFLVGFFANAITLMITSGLMDGFEVSSWGVAFFGGLFLSFINMILTEILDLNSENSFYTNLVLRQAARQAEEIEDKDSRGLLMVEIDGLSYKIIQEAIDDGYMPNMKKLIDEAGYQISLVDCGLPATTPACQAGILLGNNENIPAFRWLNKETGKMLAGGQAAAIIEPELSDGNGLLRGGSSISNMFSGDADKSILTFSKITEGTREDKRLRARDMYMLMRNPTFFMRVLVLFFGDVILELWQGWQQRRKDVQPRLNRLHNGYPFLRAATTVFIRDIAAYLTILDIVRGIPAIYTLYAGYDEVAHHSGPRTSDAMHTLRQFDHTLALILKFAREKAPRPYEFILLSDHGQSFGHTFKQRYDISILDFIQEQLPHGTSAVATAGGDDGAYPVAAMMQEMQNIGDQDLGGTVGQSMVKQTQKAIENNPDFQDRTQEVKPAEVTLCYSGNLAQVYFDLYPRRITLNELNDAYPGMVDALVQHEGIGFVVAYEDNGQPVAFGKDGARNLHTGDVVGEDPLIPFGDVELRNWQVRRIADFSNGGDLILNSTIYPDGTVAALEELIGNHGGLGGEQTEAFVFHPADMQVPEIRNSYEMKALLDSRRGLLGATPLPERPEEPQIEAWSPAVLAKGIGQVSKWLSYAAHAITLNRETYSSIAKDAYMTGPALLIILLSQILQVLNRTGQFDIIEILARIGAWLVGIVLLSLAARPLRGKGDFTSTLRVAGFAQSAHILELLGFLPVIGPLARIIAVLLTMLGVWLGTAVANDLKGWRTFLLPVIYILTTLIAVVFLMAAYEGVSVTLEMLLRDFGLSG
ncbi:phage holin family protein [Chloroflexota bacterium]